MIFTKIWTVKKILELINLLMVNLSINISTEPRIASVMRAFLCYLEIVKTKMMKSLGPQKVKSQLI